MLSSKEVGSFFVADSLSFFIILKCIFICVFIKVCLLVKCIPRKYSTN